MKQYSFTINGTAYDVTIQSVEDGKADVTVNGTPYQVQLGESVSPEVTRNDQPAPQAAAPQESPEATGGVPVPSPLPGVIIEIAVKEGQAVRAGEKLAVLEAMKMENEICAPKDGTVTAIHVSKGDSILEGAPVVTLA